jgi:predicted metallopeptidase
MSRSVLARSSLRPQGFDFTLHMRRLCEDVVDRCPELSHIDFDYVAVSYSQARKAVSHGLYATLTPMRFEKGRRTGVHSGRRCGVQRVYDEHGREMLYILSFYLPRYLDTNFDEKLTTIFHELWHISPKFDGDLRRHPGRCYMHSVSQKEYDAQMRGLVRQWLKRRPPERLYSFLRLKFSQLQRLYGEVYGLWIPKPKLLPLE